MKVVHRKTCSAARSCHNVAFQVMSAWSREETGQTFQVTPAIRWSTQTVEELLDTFAVPAELDPLRQGEVACRKIAAELNGTGTKSASHRYWIQNYMD